MVDIDKLRQEIRQMTRRTKLYAMLKEELTASGYWKLRARGNPVRAKEVSDKVKAQGRVN